MKRNDETCLSTETYLFTDNTNMFFCFLLRVTTASLKLSFTYITVCDKSCTLG